MSAPSPSRSATAAASTADNQPAPVTDSHDGPRHFHGGGTEPSTAAATGSADHSDSPAAPPPAPRLYKHALESIFAFLDLSELTTALRASRDWQAAVGSMGRLNLAADLPAAALAVLAQSMMGRHVGDIGRSGPRVYLDAATLSVLAYRMAHLRELNCAMELPPPNGLLAFPAALRRLDILLSRPTDAAVINAVIAAIGGLPLLEALIMNLPVLDSQLSFAPLAALPQLRRLVVFWHHGDELSDAQIDEFRSLPHLQSVFFGLTLDSLRRLLRQPHQLRWQQIALPIRLDDAAAALLLQLPSLTQIDEVASCERFDWLRGLPNLIDVRLLLSAPGSAERAASLIAGLLYCTNIEILTLSHCANLTAAHLAELLPRLPRLRELKLVDLSIDSLSFLAQPPLTSQLSRVGLWRCRQLPLTELRHVHALRGLRHLIVHQSFAALLDEDCLSLYRPPSALMPQLEEFKYAP